MSAAPQPPRSARMPAGQFPADLAGWVGRMGLLRLVVESARHAGGRSWENLLAEFPAADAEPDWLLVLTAYCYLGGIYGSGEVVRRPGRDENLAFLRGRLETDPPAVRRFRRTRQPALTDCLARTLVAAWEATGRELPTAHTLEFRRGQPPPAAASLAHLEPFYVEARARVQRAIEADSHALDT
ncbi:MAG: hypothetical protein ACKVYV_05920 [Limisphaerales bacterium]